jgi:hypothetical protein
MNPYLSNTMPELTDDEFKSLGMYTVSYFDEKVNCMVATKNGSWYLFFKHAGIEAETEQELAKEFAYNTGELTILNTKTGREATIVVSNNG